MTTELRIVTAEGVPPSDELASRPTLSSLLRLRTAAVHRTAERSGIIADILTSKVSRYGYALYLANLLPVYEALERPDNCGEARHELHRAAAIESDLEAIAGPNWRHCLPLLGASSRYAERIRSSCAEDEALAIAHTYVRYLGDLSGGLVLARLLARTLSLEPRQLSFYQFPAIADIAEYKDAYRRALDAVNLDPARQLQVAAEAVEAFELNIALAIEVQAAAQARTNFL